MQQISPRVHHFRSVPGPCRDVSLTRTGWLVSEIGRMGPIGSIYILSDHSPGPPPRSHEAPIAVKYGLSRFGRTGFLYPASQYKQTNKNLLEFESWPIFFKADQ